MLSLINGALLPLGRRWRGRERGAPVCPRGPPLGARLFFLCWLSLAACRRACSRAEPSLTTCPDWFPHAVRARDVSVPNIVVGPVRLLSPSLLVTVIQTDSKPHMQALFYGGLAQLLAGSTFRAFSPPSRGSLRFLALLSRTPMLTLLYCIVSVWEFAVGYVGLHCSLSKIPRD